MKDYKYTAGEVIFNENDEGDSSIYLITSGKVMMYH